MAAVNGADEEMMSVFRNPLQQVSIYIFELMVNIEFVFINDN